MLNALPLTILWLLSCFVDGSHESSRTVFVEPPPYVSVLLSDNSSSRDWVSLESYDGSDPMRATSGARCYPNPFRPTDGQLCKFVVFLAEGGSVSIEIFNLFGNPVYELKGIDGARGENNGRDDPDFTWDGRDNNDRPVAAGGYIARINIPGQTLYVKVAVQK